jgi:UDP-3-O-[3-hydroxymyristoyl] glucosamine N-acyltransferase
MPITAAELARQLGGKLCGDGAVQITHIAPLDEAGPGALTWVGNAKYARRLAGTQAVAALVPVECEVPDGLTGIRVGDPDLAMCTALTLLVPPAPIVPPGVAATAVVAADAVVAGAAIGDHVYVGAGAEVGPGTQLHPGVYVGEQTRIGRDCVLWPGVVVRERVTIGDRVIIHANATIGADGFSYLQRDGRHHKIPQVGTVVIEDDVEIGANSAIDRARSEVTRIGRGTKIDNLCQIAHNVQIGEHCVIAGQCGIAGSTVLGRHVALGGQVGVIDHMRVGEGVQAAAKSAIMRDVPAGRRVMGSPAHDIRDYLQTAAATRRLPEVLDELRALRKRVEALESAKDD